MITWSSKADINEFLIYKLFIKEYNELTYFSVIQGDTEVAIQVKYLMEYPNSLRLLLESDISDLYGNNYDLIARNNTAIIYREKLTIL
jgi:hypothetical protein